MKKLSRYLLFILVCCSFLIASCKMNRRQTVLILHAEYDIETKKVETETDIGYFLQVWTDTNEHILAKSLSESSKMCWHLDCIDGKVIDSVDLSYKPNMELKDMIPIGGDSFLIAVNSVYDFDLHDGVILILDRHQHILDTINVESLPVRTRTHLMIDDENRHYISYDPSFPLVYKQNKIFVPLLKWSDRYKTTKSAVGYITHPSLQGANNFTTLPITYPAPGRNFSWPLWYRRPIAVFSNKEMFTMFCNYPLMYKYNFEEDKLIKRKFRMSTIDDISPYRIQEEAKPFDAYRSKYEQLAYDSIHKRLYVLAKVKCDKTDGPLAINRDNAIYSFAVLDENLKQIGEGILPPNYFPKIIPYKNGFILSKLGCGRLVYTYFVFQKVEDADSHYLQNQIKQRRDSLNKLSPKLEKDNAYMAYIQKVIGKDYNKYSSFLLFSESACPHCAPLYTATLLKNKQNIIDKKVAIVIVNKDTTEINDFCEALETDLLQCNESVGAHNIPVYSDSHQYYTYFMDYWINVMYISFDKKGHLVYEKHINPGDIDKLDKLLQQSTQK